MPNEFYWYAPDNLLGAGYSYGPAPNGNASSNPDGSHCFISFAAWEGLPNWWSAAPNDRHAFAVTAIAVPMDRFEFLVAVLPPVSGDSTAAAGVSSTAIAAIVGTVVPVASLVGLAVALAALRARRVKRSPSIRQITPAGTPVQRDNLNPIDTSGSLTLPVEEP
jgi:hypothetical protein